MTTNRAAERPDIVLCRCVHYAIIPPAVKEQVQTALSQAGHQIEVVDDLCGLAANRDPRLRTWAQAPHLTVVACFPRAIQWLFHAADAPLVKDRVQLLNMRAQPPEEIVRELAKESLPSASPNHQSSIINHKSDWVPWFPVIDYDRCRNCKQCLNFCLFGVYQLSPAGQVQVQKPSGCKTNCPACARMCPQKAIIFPKYADAPINGDVAGKGDILLFPPSASDGSAGQAKKENVPFSDLYDKIRQRSDGRKRFSRDGEASADRSCPTLDGLRRELGVPDDVLRSLSPAELQRITQRNVEPPKSDSGTEKDNDRHG